MIEKRIGPRRRRAFVVCLAWAGVALETNAADAPFRGRAVFTQVPISSRDRAPNDPASPCDAAPPPDGSRIVIFDASAPERGLTNLTPNFASAGKPDVSFDGTRLLFVGKKSPAERYSVWEMAADGRELREVIRFPTDCVEVVHLSSFYGVDTDQPVRQIAFAASAPEDGVLSIFTCRMDGSTVRRITFAPGGASDPCPLSDGRLLFRMGLKVVGADAQDAAPRASALFTVNTDGADLFPFAGFEPASSADVSEPCETPSGLIVYVEAKQDSRAGSRLAAVPRTESLHSRSVIADQDGASFRAPSAIADEKLLVSYRPANAESYGIFVVDQKSGPQTTLLFDDRMWDDLDPVLLAPRREPAGRSSVVNYARQTGQLYCLNAYMSDDDRESQGPSGSIHSVRVWRLGDYPQDVPTSLPSDSTPLSARQPLHESKTRLGEFQVESDGSFFLEVPAQTPLRLETLDESGRVLRGMRTWVWVMPGERRGCIGCHEDRELTPPNRHVLALRKRPQEVGNTAMPSPSAPKPPEKPGGGDP